MKLFYNEALKSIFGAPDDHQLDPNTREITRDEIPDLIANGATVDPSANEGNGDAAPAAPTAIPAASANTSATAGDTGNVVASTPADASSLKSNEQPAIPAADPLLGSLIVTPVTPGGVPVALAQPNAVSVSGGEYLAPTAAERAADGGEYAGLDHSSLLGKLLADLEGAVHMGKSEILALVDRARAAAKG